ncbi:MAG TPA: hypothetical protein VLA58_10030 [Chitinophagaceae bacterium]|nr:hypothetical protein [Chitinophagaceae bacterium]
MKLALIASTILITVLASCGQGDIDVKSEAQNSATPISSGGSSQAAPAMSAPVKIPLNLKGLTAVGQPGGGALNPEHGKPGHRCDIAVGAPLNAASSAGAAPVAQTPASTASITASSGLNPEHGKPGHRCDIAVGAPLNASPASNTTQPITVPTQASNPVLQAAASTNSASTAPGMNPEHGKPGHRCDIAVGAPLNSKPATAASKPVATPAVTPVAAGMNPQHGQPGHRCDIAVGAPLNSKPAANTTSPVPVTVPVETKKDTSGGR